MTTRERYDKIVTLLDAIDDNKDALSSHVPTQRALATFRAQLSIEKQACVSTMQDDAIKELNDKNLKYDWSDLNLIV